MDIKQEFSDLFDLFVISYFGIQYLSESAEFKKTEFFELGTKTKRKVSLPGRNESLDKLYNINQLRYYVISAYNLLLKSENYSKIKDKPEIKLLLHLYNAALNANKFQLNKSVLPQSLVWQNLKLTVRRNNKECFLKFISVGQMISLLYAINIILCKDL